MTEDITEQRLTLIPAGIPEVLLARSEHQYIKCGQPPVAKDNTSKAVKSGFLKTSTSKSDPHGRPLISCGALSTRTSYFELSSLFTIAVNPTKKCVNTQEHDENNNNQYLPILLGRHMDQHRFQQTVERMMIRACGENDYKKLTPMYDSTTGPTSLTHHLDPSLWSWIEPVLNLART